MAHIRRRSPNAPTGWIDLNHLRRRSPNSSTGWIDLQFLRRRTSAGNWFDIWTPGSPEQTYSVTHTFTVVSADAWRLPGTWGAGWRNNNIVYHGGESNNHKGLWLYGNIANLGPGSGVQRTATSGRIRIYGGNSYSGTRTVVLRPHNYITRPSGEPAYQSGTRSVNLPSRAWTWVNNLSTAWLNNILNGNSRGIGAYTTTTSQYVEMNASAILEITYTYTE